MIPKGVLTSWAIVAAISPTTASFAARTRLSREFSKSRIIPKNDRVNSPTSLLLALTVADGCCFCMKLRVSAVSCTMGLAILPAMNRDKATAAALVRPSSRKKTIAMWWIGANAEFVGWYTCTVQPKPGKC